MSRSLVLVSVAIVCGFVTLSDAQTGGAVRPEHPDVKRLIDEGRARSATFAELLDRLEATPLTVYVRFNRCAGGVAACTRFVLPVNGRRRLLVILDKFGRGSSDLIALFAHELRHALEVAHAPQVVDDVSFRTYFATIGLPSRDGYETTEALRVGRIVAAELARPPRR